MDPQQIVKTIGWLGETWGFWIQTGAFLLSALAGVAVIHFNGKQARTSALVNMLTLHKSDKDLVAATKRVNALQSSGILLSRHVNTPTDMREDILKVLNTHEFIAVGVRMRAFDESVYKQMQCSNVLRLWSAAKGFITEQRESEGRPTIFQDFEQLACRWKLKPIKPL